MKFTLVSKEIKKKNQNKKNLSLHFWVKVRIRLEHLVAFLIKVPLQPLEGATIKYYQRACAFFFAVFSVSLELSKHFLYKCEGKVSRVPELGVSWAGRIFHCLADCW